MANPSTVARAQLATLLTYLLTQDLVAAKVHLFTGEPTIDPLMTTASFSEPTGSWYTTKNASFGSQYADADGNLRVETGTHQWTYSTASTGNEIINGYYVTDSSSARVVFADVFDAPVEMNTALQAVLVDAVISLPNITQ